MIVEINYQPAIAVFAALPATIHADILTTAGDNRGRFSFIGIDPFETFVRTQQDQQPFNDLKQTFANYQFAADTTDIPFQGGAIGFFSYELAATLETIPLATNELTFPNVALNFYDLIIAFDHHAQKAYLISNGLPEKNSAAQQKRATMRKDWLLTILAQKTPMSSTWPTFNITAALTQREYIAAVKKIIDYIYAGDIFQANFTQQFKAALPKNFNYRDLFLRLAEVNPAPYLSCIHAGDTHLVGSSPERFLHIRDRRVQTKPIKGTRRREQNSKRDQQAKQQLLLSEKDRAENIMIVDLMRNDLARTCQPDSVIVKALCELETFSHVHHLVSTVVGELQTEQHSLDVLANCFPGGSITGAPKIRAMEIIAELEPTQRGPYCGAFGYLDFNGNLDLAMTIRSFAAKNNTLTWQAGGAIVADSDPESEYQESLTKAEALHRVLQGDI